MKVKVQGYFSYDKNGEKFKGGVSTVIANHLKHNSMKVTEGKEDDEYLVTRFDHTIPAINIVNIYGKREAKTSNDEIEKSWFRLMKDVKEIEDKNEALLIIGDLNKTVGNGSYGIRGNTSKVSHGGQFIRDLIKTSMYVLINNLHIVEGGPWTWVDRQDISRMICLDLGIMSVSLLPYLVKVEIDKERKFTPRRVIKTKKKTTNFFTDHYSLKVEFKQIPKKHENNKSEPTLNRGKPGGWENYENTTNNVASKIDEITDDKEVDINTVMKKLETIDTKIKFKTFGKTKTSMKKLAM